MTKEMSFYLRLFKSKFKEKEVYEIQLIDGSVKIYDNPVSVIEVAKILVKFGSCSCAGEVDGNIVDLRYV
jgi:coenzyme F420-reducing hydrogenase gamma subunit